MYRQLAGINTTARINSQYTSLYITGEIAGGSVGRINARTGERLVDHDVTPKEKGQLFSKFSHRLSLYRSSARFRQSRSLQLFGYDHSLSAMISALIRGEGESGRAEVRDCANSGIWSRLRYSNVL